MTANDTNISLTLKAVARNCVGYASVVYTTIRLADALATALDTTLQAITSHLKEEKKKEILFVS